MYVRSLHYISAAIMFKWKRKEAVVYHISSYCKYSEENCSSQGELTDVIKYAALCRITRLVSSHPREFTLPSRTCEVRTTEDASPNFACLVLRNVRRPTSPDCLPNLLGTLDRDGNADNNRSGKKFLRQIVPGNFGGKAANDFWRIMWHWRLE